MALARDLGNNAGMPEQVTPAEVFSLLEGSFEHLMVLTEDERVVHLSRSLALLCGQGETASADLRLADLLDDEPLGRFRQAMVKAASLTSA